MVSPTCIGLDLPAIARIRRIRILLSSDPTREIE